MKLIRLVSRKIAVTNMWEEHELDWKTIGLLSLDVLKKKNICQQDCHRVSPKNPENGEGPTTPQSPEKEQLQLFGKSLQEYTSSIMNYLVLLELVGDLEALPFPGASCLGVDWRIPLWTPQQHVLGTVHHSPLSPPKSLSFCFLHTPLSGFEVGLLFSWYSSDPCTFTNWAQREAPGNHEASPLQSSVETDRWFGKVTLFTLFPLLQWLQIW